MCEQVSHTTGTHTHEHLHEVTTRHREERHVRFACYSFRKQSFTRTRRTYEQCSFGNLGTYLGIFLRVLEECHDLLHLLLGAIQTRHVLERHFVFLVAVEQLRFRLAYTEDASGCSTDTAAHIEEEKDEDRKR